jgi:hypothetical protein
VAEGERLPAVEREQSDGSRAAVPRGVERSDDIL